MHNALDAGFEFLFSLNRRLGNPGFDVRPR
jgi:hypothetical protein